MLVHDDRRSPGTVADCLNRRDAKDAKKSVNHRGTESTENAMNDKKQEVAGFDSESGLYWLKDSEGLTKFYDRDEIIAIRDALLWMDLGDRDAKREFYEREIQKIRDQHSAAARR